MVKAGTWSAQLGAPHDLAREVGSVARHARVADDHLVHRQRRDARAREHRCARHDPAQLGGRGCSPVRRRSGRSACARRPRAERAQRSRTPPRPAHGCALIAARCRCARAPACHRARAARALDRLALAGAGDRLLLRLEGVAVPPCAAARSPAWRARAGVVLALGFLARAGRSGAARRSDARSCLADVCARRRARGRAVLRARGDPARGLGAVCAPASGSRCARRLRRLSNGSASCSSIVSARRRRRLSRGTMTGLPSGSKASAKVP